MAMEFGSIRIGNHDEWNDGGWCLTAVVASSGEGSPEILLTFDREAREVLCVLLKRAMGGCNLPASMPNNTMVYTKLIECLAFTKGKDPTKQKPLEVTKEDLEACLGGV